MAYDEHSHDVCSFFWDRLTCMLQLLKQIRISAVSGPMQLFSSLSVAFCSPSIVYDHGAILIRCASSDSGMESCSICSRILLAVGRCRVTIWGRWEKLSILQMRYAFSHLQSSLEFLALIPSPSRCNCVNSLLLAERASVSRSREHDSEGVSLFLDCLSARELLPSSIVSVSTVVWD